MKFSVISTLFVAAVPVLATDYSMTCDRGLYNPNETTKTEVQYWNDVYFNLCQNLWGCKSSHSDGPPRGRDETASGRCLQCPSNLPATYMGNRITLTKL
ncbi:hypothetical protein E4U43_002350 [Claviceps pusilla]|uniref:Uncharacterized protein n=1 Tax=Claviceps pusilla TaxID=123648 RepID=A0A9P7N701_9HYPO|nr:hypothetical protein E4U43_002350 [Claviceps pusilla]